MVQPDPVRGLAAAIHRETADDAGSSDSAHSQSVRPGLLDYRFSLTVQVAIVVIACLIPACYVLKHYNSQTQFTSLIYFGAEFRNSALTEIKAMRPAVDSPYGYDGQFYAQVAIDPLLRNPQLQKALEDPVYRAVRIFLPAVAYLAGLGKPFVIVQVYALLNLFFWFMLLFGLVRYLRASTARDFLCILATVYTTGALISVQRALTDLPAATLGFYASALNGNPAWIMTSLAILTRQTSLIFLFRFAWPLPKDRADGVALAFRVALAVAPLCLWIVYVYHIFGSSVQYHGHFGWPFRDWALYVYENWKALSVTPFKFDMKSIHNWGWRLMEFLAPLSAMVQVCYFAVWRTPRCAYWRIGVGFAIMFIFLSSVAFVEQIAFCRMVLPMTIAFNIGLMQQKGYAFAFNFIAGNVGLVWGFIDTLNYCIFS
jgi:hypothetical protein